MVEEYLLRFFESDGIWRNGQFVSLWKSFNIWILEP
jgi:hypothetical protein